MLKVKSAIRFLIVAFAFGLTCAAFAADSYTITKDQRDIEALGEQLLATPQMKAQWDATYKAWSAHPYAATETGRRRLISAVNEILFFGASAAANSDPRRPKVLWTHAPPIEYYGYKKRGNRLNIDNPDNLYIYIPIEGASKYEITVRNRAPGPTAATFFVWDAFISEDSPQLKKELKDDRHFWDTPIAGIRINDIKKDADGSFKIIVDNQPANGRANHLRSNDDARCIFIRESLTDWAKQNPYQISVKRISGPPVGKPRSINELADKAVRIVNGGMALDAWYGKVMANDRPNVVEKPWIRSTGAATDLANRWGFNAQGYFKLAHDEALLFTVDPVGSDYLGVLVTDPWQVSIDPVHSNSSLNNAQAEHNADGTISYVVAADDPGIKNWLDTAGLSEGYLTLRWIGIPTTVPNETAQAAVRSMKVVKVADIPTLLPDATRVTREQRLVDYSERRRAVAHHYGLPEK